MSNMSYCRFENTRQDLTACLDAIRQDIRLSAAEALSGKKMFKEFLHFCQEYGLIAEFSETAAEEMFDFLSEREKVHA